MTPAQKLACLALLVTLLLVLGAGGGTWLAFRHYQPLLDVANADLASAKAARDNLVALAGEQGRKLGDLVQAGVLRELNAALALEKTAQEARSDYAAANQLLREHTGGDTAQASAAIIDKELGL